MVFFYPAISIFTHQPRFSDISYLGTIEEKSSFDYGKFFLSGRKQRLFLNSIISSKFLGRKTLPMDVNKYISMFVMSALTLQPKDMVETIMDNKIVDNENTKFDFKYLPNGKPIALEPVKFPLNTYFLLRSYRRFRTRAD